MKYHFIFSDVCDIQVHNGFMKEICSYANNSILNLGIGPESTIFKCSHSNEHYTTEVYYRGRDVQFGVDRICKNDPHFYQACGMVMDDKLQVHNTPGKNLMAIDSRVLCTGYLCDGAYSNVYLAFGLCNSEHGCQNTNLDEVGCSTPAGN